MTDTKFDVVGLGNAIVDVLAHSDDSFLADNDLAKGAMTLIDEAQAETLYAAMHEPMEQSGGSAANTIAALASLGARAAFIGKVRDDALGDSFREAIRAEGVTFDTAPATEGLSTARCLIFVTPDAQRTMNTFLGASTDFGHHDLDKEMIRASAITYLEGYLWDKPAAKQAFIRAAEIAHGAGNKVALSLSDAFCVDRHRADFLDLVKGHVDILFANEDEIVSLYQVSSFDDALQHVQVDCDIAALTRSEKGSVILSESGVHVIDAVHVPNVIDTTGAGDAYAAGFLFGMVRGLGLAAAGRIGGIAAAEVISHMGARPAKPLGDLIKGRIEEHL